MAYIPLSTTQVKRKGYIPISEQKPIESPFVDFGLPFGRTQTTTAPVAFDVPNIPRMVGGFGREVGQSISRNIASAGLTTAKAIAPKNLKPFADTMKVEDFQSFFAQGFFETVFGKGTEIKTIEDRIAEAEPKVKQWGIDLEKVSQTPGLTPLQKIITTTLSNLTKTNPKSLTFLGVMGSVGLDLTPFGGLEKNLYKRLIQETTEAGAEGILRSMGVADDLAKNFAPEVVKVASEKEAKKLIDAIVKVQSTTKPITTGVTRAYRPIDSLTQEARKYKSAEEFVKAQTKTISEKAAKEYTGFKKYDYEQTSLPIDKIKQRETPDLTSEKFKEIKKAVSRGDRTPIVINESNFVLDGHHRFNAYKESGANYGQVPVLKVIGEGKGSITKSQLTDIWKKATKPTAKERLITQAQKPPFQYKQLDDLAEKIKQKDITEQKFEEIQTELSIAEEGIENLPGKQLVRFVSRKEGEFLDFKNPALAKTEGERKAIIERNEKVMRASEKAFEGTPLSDKYDDPDVMRKAIDDYVQARDRLAEIKGITKETRKDISAVRKGERLMLLAKGDRRMAYRAVRDAFDLTESDMAKLRQGKDIMAMEKNEFDEFIGNAERMAEGLQKTREARIQLEGTIREKELRKWENVQEAMSLPPVAKMTPEQLTQLDEVLSQYKTGDEFLTVRQLQTIGRTELEGMRTTREVTDYLAKKYGLRVDELPPIKPHPWMYDTQLARQHPLYDLLVNRYNESYLKANGRIIELERQMDSLIKEARKTRPAGIGQKVAPTDKKIVEWIESAPEQRKTLEAEMTGAELKAAKKMDEVFKEYYDYLSSRSLDKKFSSRFEDKYFPHVRRGFLEAWKEDTFLKAVKEQFDQFKQEERLMTILDEKTGDVLPYEKWIGFSQFRTGGLVPTQNASRAFKSYITALEKARQWDEFIPEIMTYVHSLSPRNMTDRGLELDDSLKRFVKSWINSKKGRIEKQIVKPGGKVDWTLRMGVALTRIRDLGLNIPVGIANIFGEQAGNLTMLGAKNYAIGVSRLATSKGREITRKYANFVGKSLWEKLTEASNTAGDQFLGSMFGLFSAASRRGNQIFLLGNMTEAELKTGEISLQRLAELRKGMGKYRVVEGAESIFGKSVEGAIGGQYKRWAIPILTSTKDNATKLVKILRTKGVKEALSSPEGSELFYSVILGSAVGLGTMGYYNELKDEKDKNFIEEILYKSIRDSLSLIGALDPKFIGSFAAPRLASFIVDLTESIDQLLFIERTKEGELKGASAIQRTLTPVLIKSLFREEEQKSETGRPKTPPGLPELPSIKSNLPKLPALPNLP